LISKAERKAPPKKNKLVFFKKKHLEVSWKISMESPKLPCPV
jgi:hypothetical protein